MQRREFLASLASAGAATLAFNPAFGAGRASPLKVGLIGCGWFGGFLLENLRQCAPIEVVSLCDVNVQARQRTAEAVGKFQDAAPALFADYRRMLADRRHEVVVIATPDHWHALPAIAAMQHGADLILEKPIGIDVIEGEAMVAAARKYGSVVQVNLQRRTAALSLEAKRKYIDSGRLGKVAVAEAYCYLPVRNNGVFEEVDPPSHLDYDFWTGPAERLPFYPLKEERGWRSFMAYGNGTVGDMGVHMIDLVRTMLDLGWPSSIESTGGIYQFKESTSDVTDTQLCVFAYPDLRVTWEHRSWGHSPQPGAHWTDHWGTRYIGPKGTLNLTSTSYEFTPADGGEPEYHSVLSSDGSREKIDHGRFNAFMNEFQQVHLRDFLEARAEGRTPGASIDHGHISTACCALANLALDLGRPVAYDPVSRTVSGDPEATARLRRPYRQPWIHPEVEGV